MGINRIITILLLLTSLAASNSALAESNQMLTYQGRILRPDGNPVSGNIRFTVKVLSPSPSLCELWVERQTATVVNGVFSLQLGRNVNRLTGNDGGIANSFNQSFINNPGIHFTSADCANGSTYTPALGDDRNLKVSFEDQGQSVNLADMPIKSVPFAMQAEQIAGYSINYLFKIAGTAQAGDKTTGLFSRDSADLLWELAHNQDMQGQRLQNLGAPTAGTDAATKDYVDAIATGTGTVGVGDVTGTSPILVASSGSTRVVSLGTTGVSAGTYGNSTSIPRITVDAWGRISFVDTQAIPLASASAPGLVQIDTSTGLSVSSGTLGISGLNASIITSGTLGVSRGGTGLSNFTPYALLAANMTGNAIEQRTCAVGDVLVWSASTGWMCEAKSSGTGSVTHVDFNASNIFDVTGAPITTSGTISLSLASQAQGLVLASPTGAAGVPTFRALSASDIPGLDASKIVSGTLGVGVGGTGLVPSAGDANKVYGLDATGLVSEFKSLVAGTGVMIDTSVAGAISISTAGAGGTVTNIGAIVPSYMTVSPSAITSSGTFDFSFNSQAQALVFASPTGASGAPSFRALAGSDLPILAGTGVSVNLTGGSLEISSTLAGGTVTNVGLTAPTSVFSVTGSPVSGAGTMVIDFASQGAALVFASPTGAAGVPTFRALSALDIPGLDASKIVSGTLGVGVGGTGLVPTAGDANKVYGLDATGLASEFKSLVAGTGVSITHGTGSMVIQATGSGGTVTSVTAGTGLLGGSITSAGTLAVDVGLTDGQIVQVGTGDKIPVALIPNLDASIITSGTLAASRGGTGVDASTATDGQLLIGNGSGFSLNTLTAGTGISIVNSAGSISISSTLGGGTVTNVGLTAPTSVFSVTGSPVTGAGTMVIDFANQGAATFFAAPTGATGLPTFRALAASDIPGLDASKIVSGTLGVGVGGTGLVPTAGDANKVYGLDATGLVSEFKSLVAGTGVMIDTSVAGAISISAAGSGGTVTNIGAIVPSYMTVSPAAITSSGTFDFSFNSQAQALVFASPTGASGAPSFRALAASDIPVLDASKITSGTLPVSLGGTGLSSYTPYALFASNMTGNAIEQRTCNAGEILVWQVATGWTCEAKGSGSVSNVGLTAPTSVFTVTGSPVTGAGTMVVDFAQQGAATVFAAPTGATGVPTFRALASEDIPGLDASKITSGTLGVNRGGTGLVPSAGNANQLYGINNTGSAAEFKTLVAGTGLSITNSAGTISLSVGSTGVGQWQDNAQGIDYSAGNVGIGTTSPAYKLHLSGMGNVSGLRMDGGTIATNGLYLSSDYDSASISNAMSFDGTNYYAYALGTSMVRLNDGNISFYADFTGTGNRTPTTRMFVGKTGKVGIGTITPTAALDVTATGTLASAIRIPRDSTGMRPVGSAPADLQGMMRYNTDLSKYEVYEGSTGWTSLATGSVGTSSQWTSVASGIHYSSGSVGVGTNAPNTNLTVHNSNASATLSNFTEALGNGGVNISTNYGAGDLYTPGIFWSTADNNPTKPKAGVWSQNTNTGSVLYFGSSSAYTTGINRTMNLDQNGNLNVNGTVITYSINAAEDSWAPATFERSNSSNTSEVVTEFSRRRGDGAATTTALQGVLLLSAQDNSGSSSSGASGIKWGWENVQSNGTTDRDGYLALSTTLDDTDSASGGSERLRITSKGQVGIGTPTPTAVLDIASNGTIGSAIRIPQDTTANRPVAPGLGMMRYNTTDNKYEVYESTGWASLSTGSVGTSQWANTATGINYPSGSVGIGTTSPIGHLQLRGAGNIQATVGPSTDTNANAVLSLMGKSGGTPNEATLTANWAGELQLQPSVGQDTAFYSGGSPVMTIKDSGRVGIGTTSPTTKLDVNGNTGTGELLTGLFTAYPSATGGTNFSALKINNASGVTNWKNALEFASWGFTKWQVGNDVSGNGSQNFYIYDSVAVASRLLIDSNGRTGLGTTTPTAALDVVATGTLGSAIRIPRDSTTNRPVGSAATDLQGMLRYNTTDHKYEVYEGTTGWTSISTGTAGASKWTNVANGIHYSSGSVGIGTASPNMRLHVVLSGSGQGFNLENTSAYGPRIMMTASGSGGRQYSIMSTASSNADGAGKFVIGDENATQARMVIDSSGRIGFGTSTPTVALDVVATGTLGSAIRIPRSTAALRPVGSTATDLQGMMRYNTDSSKYEVYEGTTGWVSISTGTTGASQWTNNTAGINYSSGSVGIGVATPTSPLHVESTSNATSGSPKTNYFYSIASPSSASTATYYASNGSAAKFSNANLSGATLVGSAGTVEQGGTGALGTASGLEGFVTKYGAGNITVANGVYSHIQSNSAGTITEFRGLHINTNISSGTISSAYGVKIEDLQAGNGYGIYQEGLNDSNYFNGKVGIGTSSPQKLLDVRGTSGTAQIRVLQTGGASANANITLSQFRDTGSVTAPSVMGIGSRGNFGSPAALQAYDDALYVTGYAANGTAWDVNTVAEIAFSAQENVTSSAAGGYMSFKTTGLGTTTLQERMRIDANGRVGIGTDNPSQELEINGDVIATSYLYSSDRTLKKDIQPIDGLANILRLNGKTFKWKNNNKSDVGLIAQEVEEVFPELVATNPVTGKKSVQYGNLVAPLIESTKELYGMCQATEAQMARLQEQVTKHSRDIASIRAENEELKDRVDRLEKLVDQLIQNQSNK